MSKFLAIGHAPLPIENASRTYAPGKRTWQFVKPLLDRGHEVHLVAFRLPKSYADDVPDKMRQVNQNLTYDNFASHLMYDANLLQEIVDEFQPDYLIGITTLAASIAARLDLGIPFWADLYGSIMAEAQVKADTYNDDQHFNYFLNLEKTVLKVADKISTVSDAQRYAVIGELGLMGRLNSYTTGYEFVHAVPAGADFKPYVPTETVIRGKKVPDDAFVVLHSGGYNTWMDATTLFYGLEKAMKENSRIHFVSTGGQIDGHDDQTYAQFKNLIAKSAYGQRFHLCGWVSFDSLHNYYLESDVGIISDKLCYEAELGSRTRVLDWLHAELPALFNPISELTKTVARLDAGFTFEVGNSKYLTSQILQLASKPELLANARNLAPRILNQYYSIEATIPAFINWLEAPSQYAPDYQQNFPQPMPPQNEVIQVVAEPYTQSWYSLAQPLWSKFIFSLNKTPARGVIPLFRLFSKSINRFLRPRYKAKYEVQLPTSLQAGQRHKIPITIYNMGNRTWLTPDESLKPVNISYRWKKTNNEVIVEEGTRTRLLSRVDAGSQATLDMTIDTPNKGDEQLILEISLLQEGVAWFSDYGVKPVRQSVWLAEKL